MPNYAPDRWHIVKVTLENDTHFRVLGAWIGGYACGDSWRLNSGIVRVEETKNEYRFLGVSGSTYVCSKNLEGFANIMNDPLNLYKGKIAPSSIKELKEDLGVKNWRKL